MTGCVERISSRAGTSALINADNQIAPEPGAAILPGISARIADNPSIKKLIIARHVGMPVNPQFGPILLDHIFQSASECRIQ